MQAACLSAKVQAGGKDSVKAGDMCPDRGLATLVYEEGCQKCHSCGFSEY